MQKENANGRWYDILNALGIPVLDDPNKHSACPICGKGRNSHRFRFDDKDGRGTWICNNCGAGDGWELVQRAKSVVFCDALKLVESVIGNARVRVFNSQQVIDIERVRSSLNTVYGISMPISSGDLVCEYLKTRNIYDWPKKIVLPYLKDLMYCEKCYCQEINKRIPAMIAIVRNSTGKAVTMHRTYLSESGKRAGIDISKKLMVGLQKLNGCAIRLFKHDKTLGIAEGIETAISAYMISGVPTWSAISANIMESFEPPEEIENIIIFSDNDTNFKGQASAYKLANRLSNKFKVDVKIPKNNDWNEELYLYM